MYNECKIFLMFLFLFLCVFNWLSIVWNKKKKFMVKYILLFDVMWYLKEGGIILMVEKLKIILNFYIFVEW